MAPRRGPGPEGPAGPPWEDREREVTAEERGKDTEGGGEMHEKQRDDIHQIHPR